MSETVTKTAEESDIKGKEKCPKSSGRQVADDVAICGLIQAGGAHGMVRDARLAEYRRIAELLDRVLAEPRTSSRYQVYWFDLLRERRRCYRAVGLAPPELTTDDRMIRLACHRDANRRSYAKRKFQKSIAPHRNDG